MKKLVLILGTFLLFFGVNAQKVKMQNNKIKEANSISNDRVFKDEGWKNANDERWKNVANA